MAREARKVSKSGNYYVVLKGEELFATDEDKEMFIEILEKNFATGIVHGYELMKDEIRLVVREGEKGISMTMKPVTTSYARYFNRAHDRVGKLFAGRFKSEPLETDEEIEECIKNLRSGKTVKKPAIKKADTPKKATPKPAPKKAAVPKEAPKEQEPPKQVKKNLPSWLL